MMGNSQDEEEATAGLSLLCVANNGRARDNEEEERTTPVVGSVSGSGSGSGLVGAVFNFTNAIIGAGAMGLGGAIAQSGGLISLLCLTCFAALAKLSCDMVVELKLHLLQRLQTQNQEHEHEQETLLQLHSQSQQEQGMWLEQHTTKKDYAPEETESSSSSSSSSSHGNTSTDNNNMRQNHRNININNSNSNSITVVTYERIGFEAFGLVGQLAVSLSKGLFSFGCLVAYVIVIQDNFANGLEGAIYGNGSTTTTTSTIGDTDTNEDHHDDYSLFRTYLHCHEVWVTLVLCTVVILPMCLGRDISYLAKASFVSILAVTGIVGIVIYLYVCGDNHAVSEYVNMNASSSSISSTASTSSNDFHTHWLEIRGGLLERYVT
jgi:amino acid permease